MHCPGCDGDHLPNDTKEHDEEIRADERARIVAWLRSYATGVDGDGDNEDTLLAADAIERGEHEPKEDG